MFRAQELLSYRLASIHNVRFLHRQTERMADEIASGTFATARREFLERYRPADQRVAAAQREKYRVARARTAD